ncbi:hypothetical protein BJX99DRAFT_184090 [Aspergillus californicus]
MDRRVRVYEIWTPIMSFEPKCSTVSQAWRFRNDRVKGGPRLGMAAESDDGVRVIVSLRISVGDQMLYFISTLRGVSFPLRPGPPQRRHLLPRSTHMGGSFLDSCWPRCIFQDFLLDSAVRVLIRGQQKKQNNVIVRDSILSRFLVLG